VFRLDPLSGGRNYVRMSESLLRPRSKPKLLSLVIPLFNKEEVFQALRKRLTEKVNLPDRK